MHKKIAFLFPGQGSQYVGMGRDLWERHDHLKSLFTRTDELCRASISKLCFDGPMESLTLTENLQPAITAVNLACLACLNEAGIRASYSVGHSLGEYAALVSAGVISPDDALQLVQKRGSLMHRESLKTPGGMAAIMGMEIEAVHEIVDKARDGDILAVANHNSAQQIVLTGHQGAVARAIQLTKERKGKAVQLKVSGAWHCDLMKGAVEEFEQFMESIPFSKPKSSILFNVTAQGETASEKIKQMMVKQLVSPVKWYDINLELLEKGVDIFVEVGPKKVLAGLLKKIIPAEKEVHIFNVEDVESLESFVKTVNRES